MVAEDLEFQISQYVDGTLSDAQRRAFETLLETDADARALLLEYEHLNTSLIDTQRISEIHWERFATQIGDHLDAQTAPVVAGRISADSSTRKDVRGRFAAWSFRLRLAAAVAIVTSVGFSVPHLMVHRPVVKTVPSFDSPIDVQGPASEIAAGAATSEVSVGPSSIAVRDGASRSGNVAVAPHASKVVISEALNAKPLPKVQPH